MEKYTKQDFAEDLEEQFWDMMEAPHHYTKTDVENSVKYFIKKLDLWVETTN